MRLMPTFRKFKVKWGKSHISTHATRRPACPPHSVCGGQSGWPGSAVDRGSAGEPSGAHSLWQAAEICPTRSVCSLSRHVRVSASQAARSGCVSRGTSWLAQKTLLGTCLFLCEAEWSSWDHRRSRAPAVPVGMVHLPLRHWLWISREQN